jgi:hypothetical protein
VRREETSNGDPGGGGDPDDIGGGVLASLGEDFSQRMESVGAWCLSCSPLLASQEQEGETLSEKGKQKGMQDSSLRVTKEIFIA